MILIVIRPGFLQFAIMQPAVQPQTRQIGLPGMAMLIAESNQTQTKRTLSMYCLFSRNRTRLNLGLSLKKLALPLVTLAVSADATSALASTLTQIPIPPWATNTYGSSDPRYGQPLHQSEARSITPDGKFVVGVYYKTNWLVPNQERWGFFYNTMNNTSYFMLGGSYANLATGVGYRTDPDGTVQAIVDAHANGYQQNYMTVNGGVTFAGKRRNTTFLAKTLPYANSLGCWATNDVGNPAPDFYSVIAMDDFDKVWNWGQGMELYFIQSADTWNSSYVPVVNYSHITVEHPGDPPILHGGMMCGVSAAYGRGVGWWQNNDASSADYEVRYNYVSEWPAGPIETSTWKFAGLDGTEHGSCWSISQDGTVIFGHSPISAGSDWHGYKAKVYQSPARARESISQLPNLAGAGGTNKLAVPYGCSADGGYAVGMNYVGAELAVLWDTRDPDTNKWTVTDLTAVAAAEGILSPFIKLERAYSVGVNAAGYPVVAGYGKTTDGTTLTNRAFVMVVAPVPPRPQITSISGTGTITVYYTNTVADKTYTLQYSTNLNNTADWYTAGSKTASGTSDFQTESSVTSAERYYRLSYTP